MKTNLTVAYGNSICSGGLLVFESGCPAGRLWRPDTAETEMVGARIYLALAARAHYVAGAILLVAEVEPPLWTRFFSDGSAGSKGFSGPCGFRATLPSLASF